VQRDPRTFTLGYVANHLGTAQGVFDFVRRYVQERPFLAKDDVTAYTLGEMDAALQATRTSMWYAAWLWEQGRYDEAELASMRALHTSKQAAIMITTKAFDVCGARSPRSCACWPMPTSAGRFIRSRSTARSWTARR
jgi:alkylation response protein AidB-like acyl-CoA dehydrogenase